ncbi:hypothetical protein [Microbacterium aurum]
MAPTVAYGEGWITAIAPAPSNASITAALTSIRDSPVQAQYELEPGELRCGPSGIAPAHLTALDGETLLPLSPQLVEFYSYARFWRRSVLLHNVIDPAEYLDHATDPRINLPGLLEQEFHAPSVLVDVRGRGLDPSRCALFWLDTLEYAIYNRAYFVFDPPPHSRTEGHTHGEPEIWGFEGEHIHAPDLRSYLAAKARDAEPQPEHQPSGTGQPSGMGQPTGAAVGAGGGSARSTVRRNALSSRAETE